MSNHKLIREYLIPNKNIGCICYCDKIKKETSALFVEEDIAKCSWCGEMFSAYIKRKKEKPIIKMLSIMNGVISYSPQSDENVDIYYVDNDNTILSDYDKICSFNGVEAEQTYNDFNSENIAPKEASKIAAISNGRIIDSVDLTSDTGLVTPVLGIKQYSVGLLSDIHIDGNGDGNNEDSGDSNSDYIRALTHLNENNVNFIAINGDITYYGYEADYQRFVELNNEYANLTPIKTVRGNHDCYEGRENYNSSNKWYEQYCDKLYYEYIYNNDVYLFLGTASESSSRFIDNKELAWLKGKLEEYRNQRVFLFTHYYYGPVGNVNNISTHSSVSIQDFISMIKRYKNVVYFSGHTHLDFRLQKYGKTANIQTRDEICSRVHIPSLAKPRISANGNAESAEINAPGSQGYIMDVYENGIVLKGMDYELGKYLPIATYALDTSIINIEPEEESPYIAVPKMEMGDISSKGGALSDSSEYCRTAEYLYVGEKSKIYIDAPETMTNSIRVLCYDADKNFMTKWNDDGTNYKYISNGAHFTIPEGAVYVKARFSSTEIVPLLITYVD